MPRIPDDELARLKREVSLQRLCEKYGIELKPHGKDLVGLCPFHDDHDPSFVVSPDKNLWHCLGACGKGGSNIDFIMRRESVSFRQAVEILRECAGYTPEAARLTTCRGNTHAILIRPAPDLEDQTLLDKVRDFYHQTFLSDPKAREYLRERACLRHDAVATFKLGYANRTLGYRIPGTLDEGQLLKQRLQKLGVLRETGHEQLAGSVVIPIMDRTGRTLGLYGRKVTNHLRQGTPQHLYLPGPHRGVWNEAGLADQKEWLLCEALIDALTLWSAGFRNVTAAYGVNGFTPDHWRLLDEFKPGRVILCFDNDPAGNAAAEALRPKLEQRGLNVIRARLPEGHDINDVACASKNPAEALAAVIGAEPPAGRVPLPRPRVHAQAPAPSSSLSLAANEAAKKKDPTPPPAPPAPQEPPAAVPPVAIASALNKPEAIGVHPCSSAVAVAAPAPPSPTTPPATEAPSEAPPQLEIRGDYAYLRLGPREYRVGGLEKNNSLEVMKVALRLRHGETFHLDSMDLLQDAQRRRFAERAAEETVLEREQVKRDLGQLLLALETAQQERLAQALKPAGPKKPEMTVQEQAEALALLKAPDLVARIGEAFDACGLVGEEANRLAAYLACTSRKLDKPLAVIIQSTSAAGKSTLMEAVLAMFPEEERVKYSAMTGQSLYYLGETDLKHKVLAIVEEEGAEKASYALKLLQSEGELTIASTGKDPRTGRMETQEYRVKGPVTLFLTTTAVDIDEELLNRCLVLTVDESREQTARIHALQRQARTLEGLRLRKRRAAHLLLLRNAQRLLQPLDVMNPFADALTFTADRTRTRRDHEKYLTLIDAIALLHQHQRPTAQDPESGPYIRVTLEDIAFANRIAPELLGRGLDELPPQTRRVLEAVRQIVRERCDREKLDACAAFFSRRELRRRLGWSVTQVRFHLERLRELEYIAMRYGRPGAAFQYELLTDCREAGLPDSIGLLDVEALRCRPALEARDPLRPATCRENPPPVGGCREAARQVQPLAQPALEPNLSA